MTFDELKNFMFKIFPHVYELGSSFWVDREICPNGIISYSLVYVNIAPKLALIDGEIKIIDEDTGEIIEYWTKYKNIIKEDDKAIKSHLTKLAKQYKELKLKIKEEKLKKDFL